MLNSPEDSDNTTFDDLFLTQDLTGLKTNPDLPVPEQIEITPSNDKEHTPIKTEQLFGQTNLGELPNFNAVFKLSATNAVNQASDLIDAKKQINRTCSVCAEDIEAIDSISPGFINDKRPLGLFTQEKSKTQLNQTLLSLDKEIDARFSILSDSICNFSEQVKDRTQLVVNELESEVSDRIILTAQEIQKLVLTMSFSSDQVNLPDGLNFTSLLNAIQLRDDPIQDNETLDTIIANCDFNLQKKIKDLLKSVSFPSLFLKRLSYLYVSQKFNIDKTLFFVDNEVEAVELNTTYPYFVELTEDNVISKVRSIRIDRNITTHLLYMSSPDMQERLKNLIIVCTNIVGFFSSIKQKVTQQNNNPDLNISEKLESLKSLYREVNWNSILLITIITFLKEYLEFLYRIKDIVSSVVIETK